ncbi:MAG: maleylpyruvate isomerase N-terminal domain-containing protein [Neomegalonema sp.]|nr:maleylpyruvate isomerase N-terminal domain-containing protein [Neomegalonema sp.]
MSSLEEAAAALRLRQGQGARYDAPSAPAEALLMMRRGTAYFARKLNELSDAALREPAQNSGLSRAHVVAGIGYQARALCRLASWARTGVEAPMYPSEAVRLEEIALGATLPPRALRHLFEHSAIHLNVELRDLSDVSWDAVLRDASGSDLPAREIPLQRARMLWREAIALGNGGSWRDCPAGQAELLQGH